MRAPLALRLGTAAVWLLLLVPPFLVATSTKEAFRLPKLLVSSWLALLSLFLLSWLLRDVQEIRLAELWRRPAVRAVVPVLAVASLGYWTTAHPFHFRDAMADLWIGGAALVGWSLGLDTGRQERLLRGMLVPAAGVALIGVLQVHGLFPFLQFAVLQQGDRLAITSTAGNPGDLGAYLVLPCLIAQWSLAKSRRGPASRWATAGVAGALVLCLYALALSQTIAALAAVLAGSLALWAGLLPRRRVLVGLAGAAALAAALLLAVPPLRTRAVEKIDQIRNGELNAALSGRLDGWYAAVWMLEEHPWTGVGHGAYRPEFTPAKLALLDRGVRFDPSETQAVFSNAHNEFLEAAAEWGVPGLIALGWALWTLALAVRRIGRPAAGAGHDRSLARAGVAALAVLSLAQFPFRIALVAWPALLFLSWVFWQGDPEEAGPEPEVAA